MASLGDIRFAHTEGLSCLCYNEKGQVMTGGADGEVRIYEDIEDDDNQSHLAGEEVLSLVARGENFYAGTSGANNVQSFNMSGISLGTVVRFTADVTALDISKDNKFLAAGSDDMSIKVVDIESFKDIMSVAGHDAPVLCVSFDPTDGKFLLSTSCDGTLKVWEIASGTNLKTFERILPESNDVSLSKSRGAVAWNPKGTLFCYPQMKDSVKIISRDSWDEFSTLEAFNLENEELLSVSTWSPDGMFVSAASNKGKVFIWDLKKAKVVAEVKTGRDCSVCSLRWHKSEDLAFIDVSGYWGVIKFEGVSSNSVDKKESNVRPVEEKMKDEDLNELTAGLFDDDTNDENSFSIRAIKRETGFISDEDSNFSKPERKEEIDGEEQTSKSVVNPPTQNHSPQFFEPDIQEPFQPGSTPVDLSSRFLVWNSVGIVRGINTDEENSIEVEFHDVTVHHPIHLSNTHNHTMAALSKEGVVLACEADPDDIAPSRLFCRQFNATSEVFREWSVEMPGKEEILAICCGKGWIAAATDRRRLRLFTFSGMQLDILSLPGPVVALSGYGPHILVSVHSGMPLMGNQNIISACYKVGAGLGHSSYQHPSPNYQPLPLAPNSILSWIGFSDEGTPCVQDSSGQVRLFNSDFHSWMEVCDTKKLVKGVSDNYFIVGVSEQENNIRAILCKGSHYPPTVPKPTLVVVNMNLPMCDAITERGMLEESLLKNKMQVRAISSTGRFEVLESKEDLERSQNETLIKLFALSCRAEQETRAFDVCRMMDTNTIQIAIKYASKMRKMGLANKLSELACLIQDEEEAQEEAGRLKIPNTVEDEASCDMFDSEQLEMDELDNPILAARMKKEDSKPKSILESISSANDSRNPFKKSSGSQSSGTIRGGLVFDEMTTKKAPKNNSSPFGSSRQFGKSKTPTVTLKTKKAASATNEGKENATSNTKEVELKLLKGFQLWLAENREELKEDFSDLDDSQINSKGLEKWKELSGKEKENFKTPRIPVKKSSKRKREENGENESSGKALKIS